MATDRAGDMGKLRPVSDLPSDLPGPYAPVRLPVGTVCAGARRVPPAAGTHRARVSAVSDRRCFPESDALAHPLVDPVVSAEPVLLAGGVGAAAEAEAVAVDGPFPLPRGRLSGRDGPMDRAAPLPEPDPGLFSILLAGGDPEAGYPMAPSAHPGPGRAAAPARDVRGGPLPRRAL